MAYIDTDKAKELWSGEHPTQIAMRRIFDDLPTADVVPKSEVENFKSKGGFCPLCASYTITQEMMEELRMAHEEQGQHGDPVGEKGVNPLEAIKADIALEIFEEIETALKLYKQYDLKSGTYFECYLEAGIAELKKKYTKGGAE